MSAAAPAFYIFGANHRTSTALVRDRLFVDDAALPQFLARLRAFGLRQALILSTCDRTEIHGVHERPANALARARDCLAINANLGGDDLAAQAYALSGGAALRHLFAVASSLDSQVVGEPQVLGQLKAAHYRAAEYGMVGPQLSGILQSAYEVAKRVRTETTIARRPVSIAAAAVQIARDLHGDLRPCQALVVGLGDVGELVLERLQAAGLRQVALTSASLRGELHARRTGVSFVAFERLESALVSADIVVCASATGKRLIDRPLVEAVLKERLRRPVLFLDLGVPSDVDPGVHTLDGAFVYTFDDLEDIARDGRTQRQEAAEAAWRIVDEAVATWRQGRTERSAVSALVTLRERFEAERQAVLRTHPTLDAEQATRLLVNRLLHRPARALRGLARAEETAGAERLAVEALVRRLFGDPTDDRED